MIELIKVPKPSDVNSEIKYPHLREDWPQILNADSFPWRYKNAKVLI